MHRGGKLADRGVPAAEGGRDARGPVVQPGAAREVAQPLRVERAGALVVAHLLAQVAEQLVDLPGGLAELAEMALHQADGLVGAVEVVQREGLGQQEPEAGRGGGALRAGFHGARLLEALERLRMAAQVVQRLAAQPHPLGAVVAAGGEIAVEHRDAFGLASLALQGGGVRRDDPGVAGEALHGGGEDAGCVGEVAAPDEEGRVGEACPGGDRAETEELLEGVARLVVPAALLGQFGGEDARGGLRRVARHEPAHGGQGVLRAVRGAQAVGLHPQHVELVGIHEQDPVEVLRLLPVVAGPPLQVHHEHQDAGVVGRDLEGARGAGQRGAQPPGVGVGAGQHVVRVRDAVVQVARAAQVGDGLAGLLQVHVGARAVEVDARDLVPGGDGLAGQRDHGLGHALLGQQVQQGLPCGRVGGVQRHHLAQAPQRLVAAPGAQVHLGLPADGLHVVRVGGEDAREHAAGVLVVALERQDAAVVAQHVDVVGVGGEHLLQQGAGGAEVAAGRQGARLVHLVLVAVGLERQGVVEVLDGLVGVAAPHEGVAVVAVVERLGGRVGEGGTVCGGGLLHAVQADERDAAVEQGVGVERLLADDEVESPEGLLEMVGLKEVQPLLEYAVGRVQIEVREVLHQAKPMTRRTTASQQYSGAGFGPMRNRVPQGFGKRWSRDGPPGAVLSVGPLIHYDREV